MTKQACLVMNNVREDLEKVAHSVALMVSQVLRPSMVAAVAPDKLKVEIHLLIFLKTFNHSLLEDKLEAVLEDVKVNK